MDEASRVKIQVAQDPRNLTDLEQKHVPQILLADNFVRIKIGQISHPMEEEHYIVWVEFYADNELAGQRDFQPGDFPEAQFNKPDSGASKLKAVINCNLHGRWQNEISI